MYQDSVFHIGMPRTATTWQQLHLFPKFRGFTYLGRRGTSNRWLAGLDSSEQACETQSIHDLLWTYLVHANATEWDRFLRAQKSIVDPNRKNLISQEMILCHDFGSVSLKDRLKRITDILPGIRIFITIREQRSFLKSFHHVALKGLGMTLTQREYLDLYGNCDFLGYTDVLNYHEIALQLEQSGHQVSIIPYETFKSDKNQYQTLLNRLFAQDLDLEELDSTVEHGSDEETDHFIRYIINNSNRHFMGSGIGSPVIGESVLHLTTDGSALKSRIQREMGSSAAAWNSKKLNPDILKKIEKQIQAINRESWYSTKEVDDKIHQKYAPSNQLLDKKFELGLDNHGYY